MRDVGLDFMLTDKKLLSFFYALLLCNADIITKIIANDRLIIISFVKK